MSCDCCLGCCCYSQPGNAGMPTLFNQVTNSWSSPARFKSRAPGCAAVRPSATWQARTTCPGIIGKSYAASNWVNGWIDPITGTRKPISWQVSWGGMTITQQQGAAEIIRNPLYKHGGCQRCPDPVLETWPKCCQGIVDVVRFGQTIPGNDNAGHLEYSRGVSARADLWTKCDGSPHVHTFTITMSIHILPPGDVNGYFQTKSNVYRDTNGNGLSLATFWQGSSGIPPGSWFCGCWDQNILDDPQFSINLAP